MTLQEALEVSIRVEDSFSILRATGDIKQLANGEYVVVLSTGYHLWSIKNLHSLYRKIRDERKEQNGRNGTGKIA